MSLRAAIRSHSADHFNVGELTQQFRQHGAVTVAAGGEFHSPDVRGGRIHGQMNLAPRLGRLLRNPLPGNDWRRP
jgi:hypothetical protein